MRFVAKEFFLAELPREEGDPVIVSLFSERDGSFSMSVKIRGNELMSDYWPVYQYGAWTVQDLSEESPVVIRGLSVERVIEYVQNDAHLFSVDLDAERLKEVMGRENMGRLVLAHGVMTT